MVALASRVFGVGIDSEDMLVREVLLCGFRDRRAAARYRRLAGAPDEHRRDAPGKGLAGSGNTRIRRCLIQLAWRFLVFQKTSALARWPPKLYESPRAAREGRALVVSSV